MKQVVEKMGESVRDRQMSSESYWMNLPIR